MRKIFSQAKTITLCELYNYLCRLKNIAQLIEYRDYLNYNNLGKLY